MKEMDRGDEQDSDCFFTKYFNCRNFWRSHSIKENPLELASFVSFWCVLLGMGLVLIAYAIPRDYEFDPFLPAREMEAIEQYYSDLGFKLDVCSIIGMGFVTLGGLIMANATLFGMCSMYSLDEQPLLSRESRMEDVPLQAYGVTPKTYGSRSVGGHQANKIVSPSAPPLN